MNELRIFEKELQRLNIKRKKIVFEIQNDPISIIMNYYIEINNFLKKYEEKERLSEKAKKEFKEIFDKYEQAEKRKNKYLGQQRLHEKLVDIDIDLKEINNKIYSLKNLKITK